MIDLTTIPHINAVIKSITMVLLIAARVAIKSGNEAGHKKAMVAALLSALLFLAFYIYYHSNSGLAKFGGEGAIRYVYFTLLIIHVVGATIIVPLVPMAAYRGFKGYSSGDATQRAKHKRLVRITWPLWTFVSVSGLIVYFMALHIWPCEGACLTTGLSGVVN